MSLAISIPEKKVSAWMAETTVPGTNSWLSRLPIADSLESARDLYRALYTLNRMELAPKNRMELMELYRMPVSQVTGQLQNRLAGATFPLSLQRFKLAEFIRDLQVEMAYGFKLALFDFETVKRPVWGKSSVRAKAIFRSIHYIGNIILRSMYSYLDFPPNTWKELHSLYRYAETTGCVDEPVIEFEGEENRTSTIGKRYKECLLLGLSGPFRMPQGLCRQVNAFVYRWADLVTIEEYSGSEPTRDCQYLVDLDRDLPAVSVARKRNTSNIAGGSRYSMDLTALVDHAAVMLRRLETGTRAKDLDLGGECLDEACRNMLGHLATNWRGNKIRESARIPMNGVVSVCTGLGAIHHFVYHHQIVQDETKNLTSGKRSPLLLSGGRDELISSHRAGFRVAKWDIVNASSGGALVRGHENSGVSLWVGDLVALVDGGIHAPIKLFTVRWIKEHGQKGLEIGLELLSSTVHPILVGHERGPGSYVPGLLLEKISSGQKRLPATLVLQKDLRGKQKDIELIESDSAKPKWVRVLDQIDKTNTYERVTFANLNDQAG